MATTGDETLADEQRRRVQAGVASILAGILTLAGGVLAALAAADEPTVPLLGALREHLAGPEPKLGLKAQQVIWASDHAPKMLLVAVVSGLAAALVGLALSHLYRSTKARRAEVPRGIIVAAIAGAVLSAVTDVLARVVLTVQASSFSDASNQSAAAARHALNTPLNFAIELLQLVGIFSLGLAFVLLALNAMRVGLLTRFMGVLGIIVGVLFIFPIASPLPIVQAFWLVALGVLFLGRWPSGQPPAWVTGEAQPWPSQQELRESRLESQAARKADGGGGERMRIGPRRERPAPPKTPAPELPARRPHPSSKKKKRKRR